MSLLRGLYLVLVMLVGGSFALYFSVGLLVPAIPGVRTRWRAACLVALSLLATTGLAVVGATLLVSPDERAQWAEARRRSAERDAARDRQSAEREAAGRAAAAEKQRARVQAEAEAEAAVWEERTVDLQTLLASYDDNELAADSRFKGKSIQVSGVVDDIKNDIVGRPFVILGTGKEFEIPAVQCWLASGAKGKAARLHKGGPATLRGEVRGLMMHVQVGDCDIVITDR